MSLGHFTGSLCKMSKPPLGRLLAVVAKSSYPCAMTQFTFRVQRCFPESLAQAWGQLVTQFQAQNPQARIVAMQHQTLPIGDSLHPEILLSLLITYEASQAPS